MKRKIGVRHLSSDGEFGAELEFPSLGKGPLPADLAAIRRLAAGEKTLGALYAAWSESARGDACFAARLLLRDWRRTLEESSRALDALLMSLPHAEKAPMQPSAEKVNALASRLASDGAAPALRAAASFAHRSLAARGMVPWRSDSREVFEQFRVSLEAEDSHLWVVDLLAGLAEDA